MLSPGSRVRKRDNPARQGILTQRSRERACGIQREVQWIDGGTTWLYEDELEPAPEDSGDPLELLEQGRYGGAPQLRQLLAGAFLSQDLSGVIQSMDATSTDFYPHQYKPLLTLLDSPADGLLIADEVGLGKTIEAGLIWTELKARYDARRLLVICPAMLREKWCYELETKFGAEPRVVDAKTLHEILGRRPNREQVLVASYQGLRPPRSRTRRSGTRKPSSPRQELAEWLEQHADRNPVIDLLVLDEAHYVRNRQTANWRLAELLRHVSDHQLLLSATPINLRLGDLRNLLQLLDPDRFVDQRTFERIIELNQPVIRARDLVSRGRWPEALSALRELRQERSDSTRIRHLVDRAEQLRQPSPQERIRLAAELERLDLIAHVVCRTRKRDIDPHRIRRRVDTLTARMSSLERQLYDDVTHAVRRYAKDEGIAHAFLVALPQRLVSSCAVALLRTWGRNLDDADGLTVQCDEADASEDRLRRTTGRLRTYLQQEVLRHYDEHALAAADHKFSRLREKLRQALDPDARRKVVVFTEFRETARYLAERLRGLGLGVELLMGGTDFDKDAIIGKFRRDRKTRVLVSTDVASEGVDLQCSDLLINYDLPWNPMRIEQRIGRIDRIGQQAREIYIWNVLQVNTIDERVYRYLHQRIEIFEKALGEAEAILGEVRKLEDALLARPMTPEEEEREIRQRAAAIETARQQQERLEREAVRLEAHGQELMERIEAMRREHRWLDRDDLVRLVGDFLREQPACRFDPVPGNPHMADVGLSPALATRYQEFLTEIRAEGGRSVATNTVQRCRFVDKVTERPRGNEEIVHRFHPLVRFIAKELAEAQRYSAYACRVGTAEAGLPAGRYVLAAGLLRLEGLRNETHLLSHAVRLDTREPLSEPQAQGLLRALSRHARPWPAAPKELDGHATRAAGDACLAALEKSWDRLANERRQEHTDRAELHRELLHEKQRGLLRRYQEVIQGHEREGRDSLAKASRAKRDKELRIIEGRLAEIKRRLEQFKDNRQELCIAVVEVTDHGLEGEAPALVGASATA